MAISKFFNIKVADLKYSIFNDESKYPCVLIYFSLRKRTHKQLSGLDPKVSLLEQQGLEDPLGWLSA